MAETEAPAPPAEDEEVFVVSPTGERGTVPRAQLSSALGRGFKLEAAEATEDARLEAEYGDSPLQAAAEGAARSLTFGLSDATIGQLDEEGFRERRERNRGAALAGEVGGALLPVGAGGAISGLGRAVEGAVVRGAGTGARFAGSAARGAAEGTAYGIAEGVSQTALGKDPATWESAAATIGSNALGGALLGAGVGVGAKLLEEGAIAAGRFAQKTVADIKTPGAAVDRSAFPEIASMDKAAAREALVAEREAARAGRIAELDATKVAREAELASIEKAKDAAAERLFAEAKGFKSIVKDTFLVVEDRELKKLLRGSRLQIMKSLDNPKSFVRQRGPNGLIDGLEKQEDALTKTLANSDEVMAAAGAERQAAVDRLPQARLADRDAYYLAPEDAKLWNKLNGVKGKGEPSAAELTWEEVQTFRTALERGDISPPALQRVLDAQAMLERNQQLQGAIKELKAPGATDALVEMDRKLEQLRAGLTKSPRLEAIEAHLADLSEDTLGKKIARHAGGLAGGAVGSVGGFAGAMAGREAGAELGARAYDRIVRKIHSGTAARAKSITASVGELFASGASKATAAAARKAVPIASATLRGISYAPPAYVDGTLGAPNEAVSKNAAVNDFRARARELNALTERTMDGKYSVRMPAREALNARLAGLWAIDPDAANAIEMTHNARVEFLASKLPRNPAPPHLQVGPDSWEPSHAERAKFARYMDAVEQPEKVVARLAAGTMTPEDAEALKAVYPETYQQVRTQVFDHMAELRQKLPYKKRLALSIYLDVPVDPALTPEALSVYQRPIPMPEQPSMGGQAPKQQKPMPSGLVPATAAQRYST